MKKTSFIRLSLLAMVVLVSLAGCGQPAAEFAAGLGTGMAVKMAEANRAMKSIDEGVAALNAKARELEVLIEKDPAVLVNTLDPNLGGELTDFLLNVKGMSARAAEFKDEKGRIDWERLILVAAISIFGGGTATNIYKNSKKAGA